MYGYDDDDDESDESDDDIVPFASFWGKEQEGGVGADDDDVAEDDTVQETLRLLETAPMAPQAGLGAGVVLESAVSLKAMVRARSSKVDLGLTVSGASGPREQSIDGADGIGRFQHAVRQVVAMRRVSREVRQYQETVEDLLAGLAQRVDDAPAAAGGLRKLRDKVICCRQSADHAALHGGFDIAFECIAKHATDVAVVTPACELITWFVSPHNPAAGGAQPPPLTSVLKPLIPLVEKTLRALVRSPTAYPDVVKEAVGVVVHRASAKIGTSIGESDAAALCTLLFDAVLKQGAACPKAMLQAAVLAGSNACLEEGMTHELATSDALVHVTLRCLVFVSTRVRPPKRKGVGRSGTPQDTLETSHAHAAKGATRRANLGGGSRRLSSGMPPLPPEGDVAGLPLVMSEGSSHDGRRSSRTGTGSDKRSVHPAGEGDGALLLQEIMAEIAPPTGEPPGSPTVPVPPLDTVGDSRADSMSFGERARSVEVDAGAPPARSESPKDTFGLSMTNDPSLVVSMSPPSRQDEMTLTVSNGGGTAGGDPGDDGDAAAAPASPPARAVPGVKPAPLTQVPTPGSAELPPRDPSTGVPHPQQQRTGSESPVTRHLKTLGLEWSPSRSALRSPTAAGRWPEEGPVDVLADSSTPGAGGSTAAPDARWTLAELLQLVEAAVFTVQVLAEHDAPMKVFATGPGMVGLAGGVYWVAMLVGRQPPKNSPLQTLTTGLVDVLQAAVLHHAATLRRGGAAGAPGWPLISPRYPQGVAAAVATASPATPHSALSGDFGSTGGGAYECLYPLTAVCKLLVLRMGRGRRGGLRGGTLGTPSLGPMPSTGDVTSMSSSESLREEAGKVVADLDLYKRIVGGLFYELADEPSGVGAATQGIFRRAMAWRPVVMHLHDVARGRGSSSRSLAKSGGSVDAAFATKCCALLSRWATPDSQAMCADGAGVVLLRLLDRCRTQDLQEVQDMALHTLRRIASAAGDGGGWRAVLLTDTTAPTAAVAAAVAAAGAAPSDATSDIIDLLLALASRGGKLTAFAFLVLRELGACETARVVMRTEAVVKALCMALAHHATQPAVAGNAAALLHTLLSSSTTTATPLHAPPGLAGSVVSVMERCGEGDARVLADCCQLLAHVMRQDDTQREALYESAPLTLPTFLTISVLGAFHNTGGAGALVAHPIALLGNLALNVRWAAALAECNGIDCVLAALGRCHGVPGALPAAGWLVAALSATDALPLSAVQAEAQCVRALEAGRDDYTVLDAAQRKACAGVWEAATAAVRAEAAAAAARAAEKEEALAARDARIAELEKTNTSLASRAVAAEERVTKMGEELEQQRAAATVVATPGGSIEGPGTGTPRSLRLKSNSNLSGNSGSTGAAAAPRPSLRKTASVGSIAASERAEDAGGAAPLSPKAAPVRGVPQGLPPWVHDVLLDDDDVKKLSACVGTGGDHRVLKLTDRELKSTGIAPAALARLKFAIDRELLYRGGLPRFAKVVSLPHWLQSPPGTGPSTACKTQLAAHQASLCAHRNTPAELHAITTWFGRPLLEMSGPDLDRLGLSPADRVAVLNAARAESARQAAQRPRWEAAGAGTTSAAANAPTAADRNAPHPVIDLGRRGKSKSMLNMTYSGGGLGGGEAAAAQPADAAACDPLAAAQHRRLQEVVVERNEAQGALAEARHQAEMLREEVEGLKAAAAAAAKPKETRMGSRSRSSSVTSGRSRTASSSSSSSSFSSVRSRSPKEEPPTPSRSPSPRVPLDTSVHPFGIAGETPAQGGRANADNIITPRRVRAAADAEERDLLLQRLRDLQTELDHAVKAKDDADDRASVLARQVREAETVTVPALTAKLNRLDSAVLEHVETINDLEAEVAHYKHLLQKLPLAEDELDPSQASYTDLLAASAREKVDREVLEAQLADALNKLRRAEADILNLRIDTDKHEETAARVNETVKQLGAALEAAEDRMREALEARVDLERTLADIDDCRDEYHAMKKHADKAKRAQRQREQGEWRDAIQAGMRRREQGAISRMELRFLELNEENSVVVDDNERLSRRIATLHAENKRLADRATKAENNWKNVRDAFPWLEVKSDVVQREQEQQQEAHARELRALAARIDALEEEVSLKDRLIGSISGQVEKEGSACVEYRDRLQKACAEVVALEVSRCRQMQADAKLLNEAVAERDQLRKQLRRSRRDQSKLSKLLHPAGVAPATTNASTAADTPPRGGGAKRVPSPAAGPRMGGGAAGDLDDTKTHAHTPNAWGMSRSREVSFQDASVAHAPGGAATTHTLLRGGFGTAGDTGVERKQKAAAATQKLTTIIRKKRKGVHAHMPASDRPRGAGGEAPVAAATTTGVAVPRIFAAGGGPGTGRSRVPELVVVEGAGGSGGGATARTVSDGSPLVSTRRRAAGEGQAAEDRSLSPAQRRLASRPPFDAKTHQGTLQAYDQDNDVHLEWYRQGKARSASERRRAKQLFKQRAAETGRRKQEAYYQARAEMDWMTGLTLIEMDP